MIEVIARTDFTILGREARCGCGRIEPSSVSLAFFEFTGAGSARALKGCRVCGYDECAHEPEHMATLVYKRDGTRRPTVVEDGRCTGFVPSGPWRYDTFYCGCRGWD